MGLEPMNDMQARRERSLATAKDLGYLVNEALPLIDEDSLAKSLGEVVNRVCALNVAVAHSFGFSAQKSFEWLEKHNVIDHLTDDELDFLKSREKGTKRMESQQDQVEGLWTLTWALGIHSEFDFSTELPDSLVSMLPDLKSGEAPTPRYERRKFRELDEILGALDLGYCLHWALREEFRQRGSLRERSVPPYVIIERRRALEWLVGDCDWDSVILDT